MLEDLGTVVIVVVVGGGGGGGRGGGCGGGERVIKLVGEGERESKVYVAEGDLFVDSTEPVHFLFKGIDAGLEVLVRLF